ncbi:LysR family transcriptional regulator [Ensifer sp. SL37]|uniref:LysR family transcriptional regulator n=1 Tax=Ensifer sp. SL37 TaxID=2995137 RepID=UPI002DD4472B|nr:LysR family transcriptional regulator [Ensifer sp. SL37]
MAECGHFSIAAKRCHVSQPTLSVQIGLVEDNLGVQIFERTSSAVLTTRSGYARWMGGRKDGRK